jgi:hypothetical protein
MMGWLLTTRIGRALGIAVAFVMALVVQRIAGQREGRMDAENKGRENDIENANDIRDRVSNADDSLRKFDDAGFRD